MIKRILYKRLPVKFNESKVGEKRGQKAGRKRESGDRQKIAIAGAVWA
jgi:hypothetical protein